MDMPGSVDLHGDPCPPSCGSFSSAASDMSDDDHLEPAGRAFCFDQLPAVETFRRERHIPQWPVLGGEGAGRGQEQVLPPALASESSGGKDGRHGSCRLPQRAGCIDLSQVDFAPRNSRISSRSWGSDESCHRIDLSQAGFAPRSSSISSSSWGSAERCHRARTATGRRQPGVHNLVDMRDMSSVSSKLTKNKKAPQDRDSWCSQDDGVFKTSTSFEMPVLLKPEAPPKEYYHMSAIRNRRLARRLLMGSTRPPDASRRQEVDLGLRQAASPSLALSS